MEEIKVYENKEICAKCKGRCCKFMGCNLTPDDVVNHFGPITEETILKLLKSGGWAMDWYEHYSEENYYGFYLRARNVNDRHAINPAWSGQCVHLTETGCKFDFEHRPTGGKSLKPKDDFRCEGPGKYFHATLWYPYYDILEKIYNTYYHKL